MYRNDEIADRLAIRELVETYYHDELTRTDGRWGFARRRFQPLFLDTGAVPGTVPGQLP